ncbi:MAG: lysophospholipid acyltransferase family protein [Coprococcus sp.]
MVRLVAVVISCIFLIIYYVPKMSYYARHPEKYDEYTCYKMVQVMVEHVRKRGRITTVASGMEKLPEEGGYIMYANHQGKWDALGVIAAHERPLTFIMDAKRSNMFIVDQLCNMMRAQRLDKEDIEQQIQVINDVATEIKAGRRYLMFPEGGYDDNKNTLSEFSAGSFKIAKKAKCPIVPVVLYDSFKPFGENSLKKVITQLAFLDPIPYEKIEKLKTTEIRDMVVSLIEAKINTMESMNDW